VQLRDREEERQRKAARVRVQEVRDAAVEPDQRAPRGDVPGDREEEREPEGERAPARDRERAR